MVWVCCFEWDLEDVTKYDLIYSTDFESVVKIYSKMIFFERIHLLLITASSPQNQKRMRNYGFFTSAKICNFNPFWCQGPISEALLSIPYGMPNVIVIGNVSSVEVVRDRKSGASKLLCVVRKRYTYSAWPNLCIYAFRGLTFNWYIKHFLEKDK